MEILSRKVVFGVVFSVLFASAGVLAKEAAETPSVSPEQQKRIDLLKSRGPEASLTILPIQLPGTPIAREFRDCQRRRENVLNQPV